MWTGKFGEIHTNHHLMELKLITVPVCQMPCRIGHRENESLKAEVESVIRPGVHLTAIIVMRLENVPETKRR